MRKMLQVASLMLAQQASFLLVMNGARANSYLMAKRRLGVSTCPLMHRLLIKVVSQRAKTKAGVFQKGVVQRALREMGVNDPQELAGKIAICFCCFLVFSADQRR